MDVNQQQIVLSLKEQKELMVHVRQRQQLVRFQVMHVIQQKDVNIMLQHKEHVLLKVRLILILIQILLILLIKMMELLN